MTLEAIIRFGNQTFNHDTTIVFLDSHYVCEVRLVPSNIVRCVDGFQMSVIAGHGAYCSPRPGYQVPVFYQGPYHCVEVGMPSERPEPWQQWAHFADDDKRPTDTVYPYVPVKMVRELVALHGGDATDQGSDHILTRVGRLGGIRTWHPT